MSTPPEEPSDPGFERDEWSGARGPLEGAFMGWVHPDDRLWRHPSEQTPRVGAPGRPPGFHHPKLAVLIGAAAALAAVAWTVVLLSPPSAQSPTSATGTTSVTTLATLTLPASGIPSLAAAAGRSMVQLRAETSRGSVSVVGVAVAEGGLVVTTADELAGLRRLWMVGADGQRRRAAVVAVDAGSDLALVSVPDDLPVAPFDSGTIVDAGSPAMVLSMASTDAHAWTLDCQPGTVTAVDWQITGGWAEGMPAVTTSGSTSTLQGGDPLVNPQGVVVGIYYDGASGPTYLPSPLVLGVADLLRSTGRISHGWLGLQGGTAPSAGGVVVDGLMPGSPASGLVQPGDVVVAAGSTPVRSMADLRAALYVMSPQSTVDLSVLEGGSMRVVDVTLGTAPSMDR